MPLRKGLWLTLLDEAGEATPVACELAEQQGGVWVLEALVPPQVYPVRFLEARLRLDGHHLGHLELSEPLVTTTHQTCDVRLAIPVDESRLPPGTRVPDNGRRK